MGIFMQILGLLASLTFLVVTHELGHFVFAKLFKTRVEQFYAFFNPSLTDSDGKLSFSFTSGFAFIRMKRFDGKMHFSFFARRSPAEWADHPESTEWGLGWLPLGGYCSIAGMVDETTNADDLSPEVHDWEFRAKPAWQRFFIIIGGVLVNFLTAIIIYILMCFTWGSDYIPLSSAKYGLEFSKEMQDAGFRNGDKVLMVDTSHPQTLGDFANNVLLDNVKTVTVERDGETVVIDIPKDLPRKVVGAGSSSLFCNYRIPFVIDSVLAGTPADKAGFMKGDSLVGINDSAMFCFFDFKEVFNENKGNELQIDYMRGDSLCHTLVTLDSLGNIGVGYKQPADFFEVVHVDYTFWQSIPTGVKQGFSTLGNYVKQFKIIFTKEGATQLGSFLTIGSIFPKVWDWYRFWSMTALLGIILAFMNIIPIPGLDGGYILFILVEMITGKKPSDKFLGVANTIGFVLLIALMVYALGLDFRRFIFK